MVTSLALNWFHSIYYVRKIFRKTNISYPLIHTGTSACQEVRNESFLEKCAYVLYMNEPIGFNQVCGVID